MANDVHETFVKIIQSQGGKTEQQARDYLKTMSSKKRYQQDVWG